MCHINISCVYAFNITSSLINIHAVKHINDCKAEEEYSQLSALYPEFKPSPGGQEETPRWLWLAREEGLVVAARLWVHVPPVPIWL